MDDAIIKINYMFGGWGPVLYCLIVCSISVVLSFFIGIERELHGRPAVVVTHALIALSCSILSALSVYGLAHAVNLISNSMPATGASFQYKVDISRVISAVVTGLGFLGAGVIIKSKASVKGLSTSATIFAVAGISLAVGAGYILEAIIAAAIIVVAMSLLRRLKKIILTKSPKISIIYESEQPLLLEMMKKAEEGLLVNKNFESKEIVYQDKNCTQLEITFAYSSNMAVIKDVVCAIKEKEFVYNIDIKSHERKTLDGTNE